MGAKNAATNKCSFMIVARMLLPSELGLNGLLSNTGVDLDRGKAKVLSWSYWTSDALKA